ncbi:hypothetical protein PRIPAC_95968 [Pristionchus pacificus]|uniref:Uncharacterized protein n=1 Tax=Pristionchus pacificus TaxID=54126 RepID=A0A2A6D105_PRIPA|nr:hypothetical protein PRIPAC_95968 [Pristionchus pacificus]|eukprot:PDM84069.1 hypothetical protein PRIPAC_34261 [Pristionchus pacificus]
MQHSLIVITTILSTISCYDAYSAYREQRSIYSRPDLDLHVRKPIGFVAGEPMADEENAQTQSDAQRKAAEREAKKAEVRKRLEESGKAGQKKKKGFLTPQRKKKLRKLLMFKAAEDLKKQQLIKDQERQKVLSQRTIPLPAVDGVEDKGKLESIYNDLFDRLCTLESEKFDINQLVLTKETEINELTIAVNDLRGKFVKPTLKKVSKYDNKFKKMAEVNKKEEKADFRNNLKTVKKENVFSMLSNDKKKEKPVWSKKGKEEEKKEEVKGAPVEVPPAEEAPAEQSEAEEVSEAEASEAE